MNSPIQSNDSTSVRDAIVDHLRTADTLDKAKLRTSFGLAFMNDRDFGLLIHDALQILVEEGRVFVPCGLFGQYRLAGPKSANRRARNFKRAAERKIDRAVKLASVAAEIAEDPEEKRKLERSALRMANKAIDARTNIALASKMKPKGLEKT